MIEANVSRHYKNAKLLTEVLDKNKVMLTCSIHNYVAGRDIRRHTGCKQCIMADYIKMFAEMPPEVRQERLDQFEGLVHAMCELEDAGKLDMHVNRQPIIEVEKDALPD